jgi:UDP-N-acetylglucosamine transferase subunit ALG13
LIFVTIGTSEPFDRLLEGLRDFDDEELVIQCGDSTLKQLPGTTVSYLEFHELEALVERARVVVSHAGVGTILVAVAKAKRPLVVPRLARHGEAVDDHQVALARKLQEAGVVTLLEDPSELPALLRSEHLQTRFTPSQSGGVLVAELREYIDSQLAEPRRSRPFRRLRRREA